MTTPRSVRFDPHVMDRLQRAAGRHPGTSVSALVNRYVDEAMRMEEHPGVFFRNGAAGRRAVLIGGPDVWEVVRAIKIARGADASPSATAVLEAVADSAGLASSRVSIALRYWSAYPDEIDDWIAAVEEDERAADERWQRENGLLAS